MLLFTTVGRLSFFLAITKGGYYRQSESRLSMNFLSIRLALQTDQISVPRSEKCGVTRQLAGSTHPWPGCGLRFGKHGSTAHKGPSREQEFR